MRHATFNIPLAAGYVTVLLSTLALGGCEGSELSSSCEGASCMDGNAPIDGGSHEDSATSDGGGSIDAAMSSHDADPVADAGPDTSDAGRCVPACAGRTCGSDGCGGSCAPGCGAGESCSVSGQCTPDGCTANCAGRECGPDPICGQTCGNRNVGESCNASGACVCEPTCTSRECGDDGCGGTCGAGCTGAETCNAAGQCELGFRPYTGPMARVRLINGDLLTSAAGRKVCLFGTDDDRPYAVLNALGFAAGSTVTIDATYVEVPAGIALRASQPITIGLGTDTADGCALSESQPLGDAPLMADRYYTIVARNYDEFFTRECAANPSETYCEFYGRSRTSETEVPCATEGVFLFEDGNMISGNYANGLRVVNLTSNASQIALSFESGSSRPLGNVAGGERVNWGYNPFVEGERLRICPSYLDCDPSIDPLEAAYAMLGCTDDGASAWLLGEVTSSRFSAPDRNTTVYIFGNAGRLNSSGTAIVDADIGIAVAHDVTDGALP